MTEEQNRLQYESFVTSAINCGALDMIVGYKEWLETIRSYTPPEVQDDEWDIQIRQDFEAGKFDQMIEKARQEHNLCPVLRLSEKDAEKFVEIMGNPPKLTEELKRLLRND